ncbi:CCAAT/enhancer-binding protein alpha [Schistocerca gregaria]|uniref:CCAAT/enhancer-binding protein alpha n=1 Tax=Schistocerca gregaria TaxID=7010 RepID=UPI00211F0BBA|nr:CCAAT/enhancer-binding protein alpha [Schistocerca gregaria]
MNGSYRDVASQASFPGALLPPTASAAAAAAAAALLPPPLGSAFPLLPIPLPLLRDHAPATGDKPWPALLPRSLGPAVGGVGVGVAVGVGGAPRRPRSEKRPIPDDQKDEKYFERRKRNNQAAKKSRDARKVREDQIALRAAMLEHENAVLRAQLVTLREEAHSLRHLLLQQRALPES